VAEDGDHAIVGEGRPRRDMAPMTGRSVDRQKDQFVFAARPLQGIVASWVPVGVPVDTVFGVCDQTGPGRLGQA